MEFHVNKVEGKIFHKLSHLNSFTAEVNGVSSCWAKNISTLLSDNLSGVFTAVEVVLDSSMVEEFLSEVVIMRKFKHPNVMKLLGVTVHEDKPCIVLPLMMIDLKRYLKQNRLVSF